VRLVSHATIAYRSAQGEELQVNRKSSS